MYASMLKRITSIMRSPYSKGHLPNKLLIQGKSKVYDEFAAPVLKSLPSGRLWLSCVKLGERIGYCDKEPKGTKNFTENKRRL